jgi:hypothetical protein
MTRLQKAVIIAPALVALLAGWVAAGASPGPSAHDFLGPALVGIVFAVGFGLVGCVVAWLVGMAQRAQSR